MLEVRSLTAGYDQTQILWGVSVEVRDGEVVALMGPNGSGKSTLMNSVSGLVRMWSGEIRLKGEPIHTLPPHRMLEVGISHVLERHRLFPYMTVLENLQLGCGPRPKRGAIEQGLEQAYALFPRLFERTGQMAHSLSGGEQQMCAIARGLMSRPRLLLVDEPFIGLSPQMRAEVARAIQRINAGGVSVLLIEQNVAEALRLCHRAYVLREGRVALSGEAAALRGSGAVQDVFLGRVGAAAPLEQAGG
ncbi:MAG: ABC transporter ATP-binding protein [Betaproteobacteria bacterium]|nr:ABC transporter ATP-binding protein [Betaproteobacteria bacterium]